MRTWIITAAVAGGLVAAPAGLAAQAGPGAPTHEFGADLGATYTSIGSGCTGSCGIFSVATPVDLRVGFLTGGPFSIEPRLALSYMVATSGGGHVLVFTPGVNVLYKLGGWSGASGLMGPYVTAGAAVELTDVGGFGGSTTQPAINVGLGQRLAWGSAAFRPEAFVRYRLENKTHGVPAYFDIGLRIGVSLFH